MEWRSIRLACLTGSDGMGTDDMWLDFFPGLLTQSDAS